MGNIMVNDNGDYFMIDFGESKLTIGDIEIAVGQPCIKDVKVTNGKLTAEPKPMSGYNPSFDLRFLLFNIRSKFKNSLPTWFNKITFPEFSDYDTLDEDGKYHISLSLCDVIDDQFRPKSIINLIDQESNEM